MKRAGARAFALAVALLAVFPLGASGWAGGQDEQAVPPSAQARQSEASLRLLIKTPVEKLKAQELTLEQDGTPVKLSLRLAVKGTLDAQLWEYRYEPGQPWGPGTWVVFRDGLGRLREVRIVVLGQTAATDHRVDSTGTWVRLSPVKDGRRTRLDLFLAGRLVTGGWEVTGQLQDLVQSDDDWVFQQTANQIDWGALLPLARTEDARVESLQKTLHKTLSTIPVVKAGLWLEAPQSRVDGTDDTGAPLGHWGLVPGQEGEAQRGLGSWGVVHWLTTAVLRGWKAPVPDLKSLLVGRSNLPGYSQALVPGDLTTDPAFSLDWIRNLGLAVFQARYPSRPVSDTGADLTEVPYLDSQDKTGFAVDDFAPLMHLLATTKPGKAYLATLSSQSAVGGAASAVHFREPSVVLPWVGNDGDVRVSIYQGPRELTREQWLATAKAEAGARPDHVILVELPLPASVPLPVLPLR
ncbi:MAG: hypothetical protein WCG80_05105 [Spirochaetales bacterium]